MSTPTNQTQERTCCLCGQTHRRPAVIPAEVVRPKAEIEIASLHDKVDHLLHAQWERMVELQQMQMELLTEIAGRSRAR